MDGSDLANLLMLGGDEFLAIWAATHPGTEIPSPPPVGTVALPGVQASFNTNLLIIAGLILAVVLLSK